MSFPHTDWGKFPRRFPGDLREAPSEEPQEGETGKTIEGPIDDPVDGFNGLDGSEGWADLSLDRTDPDREIPEEPCFRCLKPIRKETRGKREKRLFHPLGISFSLLLCSSCLKVARDRLDQPEDWTPEERHAWVRVRMLAIVFGEIPGVPGRETPLHSRKKRARSGSRKKKQEHGKVEDETTK